MGHGSDRLYLTHAEHASGSYTAGNSGFQGKKKQTEFQNLPFDCCALSLVPFVVPIAVREQDNTANVFDLVNILPYIKKYGLNPVTGRPLAAADLIKLKFFKTPSGTFADPVTFKPFTPHTHIVFIASSGNVFAFDSIDRLCIKTKSWRDLIDDTPFKREDIVTIQDPHNLSARDLSKFDYVQTKKSAAAAKDQDRLSGINVAAFGSAGKVLKEVAAKNTPAPPPPPPAAVGDDQPEASGSTSKEKKVGVVAAKPKSAVPYNAAGYTTGRAAASLTSTAADIETGSDLAIIDEEEYMFDEIANVTKEKDRIKRKGYARINTNFGALNVELHCDKAPKTCYNWIMLAKAGKYDNVIFHRNIPGFMIQGGDPTGKGTGGQSHWGHAFRDEYDLKGALKHTERGVMSMANSGAGTNGSQFFFAYRATPHLDGKHTVFGGLVGGQDVLTALERVTSNPATDRPLKEIKIINVEVFQNPYETYKSRLANRLAASSANVTEQERRERSRMEREADRTSWFGEDLDKKKAAAAAAASASGGKSAGTGAVGAGALAGAGVGMYLAGAAGGGGAKKRAPAEPSREPEKKKRKGAGGFGDFSSW